MAGPRRWNPKRRRVIEPEHEGEPWLTTYGDLMTLLLVFFVLFYIFSVTGQMPFLKEAFERFQMKSEAPAALDAQEFEQIEEAGGEIVISIPSNVLFDLGQADIKREAMYVLQDAVKQIKDHLIDAPHAQIRVEGYTDNLPIHNYQFRSNWELSAARAIAVVKYLIEIEGFKPERLQAMGYGEYNPVVPNDTAENRQKNRRVEIKIVKSPVDQSFDELSTGAPSGFPSQQARNE